MSYLKRPDIAARMASAELESKFLPTKMAEMPMETIKINPRKNLKKFLFTINLIDVYIGFCQSRDHLV